MPLRTKFNQDTIATEKPEESKVVEKKDFGSMTVLKLRKYP